MASVQSAPAVPQGGASLPLNLTPQIVKEYYAVRFPLALGFDIHIQPYLYLSAMTQCSALFFDAHTNSLIEISADESPGCRRR